MLIDVIESYALSRDIRAGSVDQLRYAVRSFSEYLGRPANESDLSDDPVNRFILWLASKGYAHETIKTRRRSLLTVWRYLSEDGMVSPPRRIRNLSPVHSIPRAWNQEQVHAIVAQTDKLTGTFRSCPTMERSKFAKALCLTLYESGLRRSDVLRIRRPMIQPSGLIPIVQSKTGRVHLARIRPETIAAIDTMGTAGRATIFDGVISIRRMSRLCKTIFKQAGIPEGSIKWFRRSGATHVEMAQPGTGWRFLGHTGPRIAEASYIDPLQVGERAILPPKFG